ncbi:MAG: fatty acid desaturase [Pseudomonadota bacterium]
MTETLGDMDVRASRVAQRFMGATAWPTILGGSGLVVVYAATLVLSALGALPLWIAFPLTAALVFASYTVMHESVHGSICGKDKSLKWLNDALGFAVGQILGGSYLVHQKEHMAHHRHTNEDEKDPDKGYVGGSVFRVLAAVFVAQPSQLRFYMKNHWQTASTRTKSLIITEYAAAFAWRLAFIVLAGWQISLMLLLGATAAGIFVLLATFAWVVHRPFDVVGRYKDTSAIVFPEPFDTVITWLWLYQNYHAIHHLFPRVPFYHYRNVFAEIEDVMIANGAPILRVGTTKTSPIIPTLHVGKATS